MIATLDDHELADNAWAGGAEEHDDVRDGPWSERQNAALRAWEEWMPTVRCPSSEGDPVYSVTKLGQLATIALLETRTGRWPEAKLDDPTRARLIDERQRKWLDQLSVAAEGVLVVGSPSVVSPIWDANLPSDAAEALQRLKMIDPTEAGRPFYDLWDAYPNERAWMFDALAHRGGDRSVIVSGDVHVALEATLDHRGQQLREWTTSSITSQNLSDKMNWIPHTDSLPRQQSFLDAQPHFRFCDFDSHGFMIVTITSDQVECEWWEVQSVRVPTAEATLIHSASFSVGQDGEVDADGKEWRTSAD